MTLYEPARHEPLLELDWNEERARAAIARIVADTKDPRWIDLYRRHFNALWEKWEYAGEVGCHLWTHDL